MSSPRSFVLVGREGVRYRVYLNMQTGYWFVSYNSGKGRKRVSLRVATRAEAEVAVRQLDAPLPVPKREEQPALKWKDFQMRYLDYKTEQGKAPRTVERYKSALEAFGRYLRSLKVETVNEVGLQVLEGYVRYRTKREGCKAKTAYCDSLTIKNAFRWGSKPSRGLLKANPALDWELVEPVTPKRRCYVLSEVEKMAAGVREWLRPVVVMLAWTGMRIGELVALRWQDIDLEQGVIHVRVQEEWKPKGRRDRTIPMFPKVKDALLKQARIGRQVFHGRKGGKLKETYCLACLKKDQGKMGMVLGDLHAFRRFFATTMIRAGVDIDTVRQWGGWKSLETMLRYLADVEIETSVKAMAKAAKRLEAGEFGKILAMSGTEGAQGAASAV